MRWERLKMNQKEAMSMEDGPQKRWGHTCNAIKGGKLVYVFGGYGHQNSQTNQVHVFHTDTQRWSDVAVKGIPPTPRDSHTCTTVGDNLFVFGGTDGLNPLRDLHILDTSSNTWISPSVRGDGPEAREGHCAALIGKRIFVFGGCGRLMNSSREVHYNDLYVLNTETYVWQRAMTSGMPPAARDSHSCSSWKNKIIVIGGEDENDYYLSDVHILDTDALVWKEVHTSGQLLPPRAGHTTVAFGKYIFVFGGFTDAQNLYDDLYMLDLDTGVWTKVVPNGEGPSARFSMSGDCLDPSKGGVLVFIGGCNQNLEALDDMYYLHTELVRDDGRDEQRLEKLSMRKQLKLKCQEQYVSPPGFNKEFAGHGTADFHTPPSLPFHSQRSQQYFHLNRYRPTVGKRTFQAKVTKSFAKGYSIETVIDGKPLHGIVFSTSSTTALNENLQPTHKTKPDENQDPTSRDSTSREAHTENANTSVLEVAMHSEEEAMQQEVTNTESENLMVSNVVSEVDKPNETPSTENLTTSENPHAMAEGSLTSHTDQDDHMVSTEQGED